MAKLVFVSFIRKATSLAGKAAKFYAFNELYIVFKADSIVASTKDDLDRLIYM